MAPNYENPTNPVAGPNTTTTPGSPGDAVVQVWRRGYVTTCVYGSGVLVCGGLYAFFVLSVGRPPISEYVTAAVVLTTGILIIFNGFYRKATLRQRTLVLRKLLWTRTIPLGEITEICYPGAAGFHIIDSTSVAFYWGPKRRYASTRSFGGVWWSVADQIKALAAAEGAKIIGYNAEREVG